MKNIRNTDKEKLITILQGNTYKITVVTGKVSGAGTDTNVFIVLHGERGDSSHIILDNKGKDDFETGTTCAFNISMDIDLGKLKNITIGTICTL